MKVQAGGNAGHLTPEDAAIGRSTGKASAVARAIAPDEKRAVVLVRTSSGRLIQRFCVREDTRWFLSDRDPASSAGMGNWSAQFTSDDEHGVLTAAGEVPKGADAVIIRWRDEERHVAAPNGYFIAVWWDLRDEGPDEPAPDVVRYVFGAADV